MNFIKRISDAWGRIPIFGQLHLVECREYVNALRDEANNGSASIFQRPTGTPPSFFPTVSQSGNVKK